MEIKILEAENVRARLESMRKSIEDASDEDVIVSSNLVYAPGIEFGRHPGGRLARRAGGAFALTDAFEEISPQVASAVTEAIAKGIATDVVLRKAGLDIEARTKEYLQERVYSVPIPQTGKGRPLWERTGALKNSFQTRTGKDLRALYRG